jgi:eukaryotic-like serine/threonine-protein kinase
VNRNGQRTDLSVLAAGHVFHGRYEVVGCIRSGGMGAIYEVIHIETRRRRALKIMLPSIVTNPDMQARFKLEATVAADIESEHIVETFDAGVDAETGAPFLVMELLRGEDLGAIVDREGALPAEDVVLLLSQAASALDKTHAAGVVHRDLKPENLTSLGAPRDVTLTPVVEPHRAELRVGGGLS